MIADHSPTTPSTPSSSNPQEPNSSSSTVGTNTTTPHTIPPNDHSSSMELGTKALTPNTKQHHHRILLSFPPSKTSSANTTPNASPNSTTPNSSSLTPFSFFKRLLTKSNKTSSNLPLVVVGNNHQTPSTTTTALKDNDRPLNGSKSEDLSFTHPGASNHDFPTSLPSTKEQERNYENIVQHLNGGNVGHMLTRVNIDAFVSSQQPLLDQNNHQGMALTTPLIEVTPIIGQQQQPSNAQNNDTTTLLQQPLNGIVVTNENSIPILGDPSELSSQFHETPNSTNFKVLSANIFDQEMTNDGINNHSSSNKNPKKDTNSKRKKGSPTSSTVTFQPIPSTCSVRKSSTSTSHQRHRNNNGSPLFRTNRPTAPKTYLKKLTFMESLSTSADPSTSASTHSSSSSKKHSGNTDIVENDLLFNDLQVFQNQVVKRYIKILEQPMVCKAFNYEVLGPQNFLLNPYMGVSSVTSTENTRKLHGNETTSHSNTTSNDSNAISSPKKNNSQSSSPSLNPYLFDDKFIQEYHWRRRRSTQDMNKHTSNIPNVPTIDIVCEDGATLSCYFEFIGHQNFEQHHPTSHHHHYNGTSTIPSTHHHTGHSDSSDSNNNSHAPTTSKKTVIFFHDGSEEAFEYFSNSSLCKFKDFILSMGLQIFIFEYRGFGFSTCARGEDERTSLHRFLETDCKLIHHLFLTRLKIPMSDVIVYGKGFLGTTCALHYVSKFPMVSGLCLESPCVDILKLVNANIPESVLSQMGLSEQADALDDLWNLNIRLEEEESIKFEFTNYNFGVEEYYRVKKPLKSMNNNRTIQRKPNPHNTTIACKVGDEKYYTMKELKNCILHHFNTVEKLSSFTGKLLILFQQGNELVPYGDIESFFKNVKTAEKNMYLLSLNEMTSSASNATDDPFNLFERKFYACAKAIHRFVQSVGHVLPENYGLFMDKLLEKTKPAKRPAYIEEGDDADLTSELSELATSSYVDTFQSFGGRGRRNKYMPPCGGCGHCRACIDQSLLEEEEERLGRNEEDNYENDQTERDLDDEYLEEEEEDDEFVPEQVIMKENLNEEAKKSLED
ncbi:hypothetical protein C9374_011095 [Naegleria lovaniensis]|uniref:Uncharacterized protein n=1 Tax=Naegleria lovaniensis TaxID=51637 RepID=A0AA88KFF0_NAELO|nr:uncharacterized protein C9374_011095 [Naegleria lovaniensis]KAG2374016.1 hypothetical protein C9374_011095 [Naegleria lovaniensis]